MVCFSGDRIWPPIDAWSTDRLGLGRRLSGSRPVKEGAAVPSAETVADEWRSTAPPRPPPAVKRLRRWREQKHWAGSWPINLLEEYAYGYRQGYTKSPNAQSGDGGSIKSLGW